MFKPVKSILFATNLSENCRPALEASLFMAGHYGADIVLLHVVDRDVPLQVEEHFKAVLGEEKWEELKQEHEQDAREALIGKMSSKKIVEKVMAKYKRDLGIEGTEADFNWRDVVLSDKNIDRAIVRQAMEEGCELIVMGTGKDFLGDNSLGATISGVLRKSKIPVMVVPAHTEGNTPPEALGR